LKSNLLATEGIWK